jgi:hypothetical protein
MKITRGNSFGNNDGFEEFLLQRMNPKTAGDRLRYSNRYAHVLQTGDAKDLLQLSPDKRIHALKGLASLARFQGCYDAFLQLRQRYDLKWSTGNEALYTFERFFGYRDGKTLDTMLQWVRQVRRELPRSYSDIFLFCTLTGLRPSESLACIKLIKNPEDFKIYYNESRQCLEHFRFPKIFIRRTKAAYVSIVDKEILQIAQNIPKIAGYYSIRLALTRQNLEMHMGYCRKIFASYLRQSGGIETEIIDLLSGRVPKSVFARHYFTPSLSYRDKVLRALNELRKEIES